jgi:hypothetical protein
MTSLLGELPVVAIGGENVATCGGDQPPPHAANANEIPTRRTYVILPLSDQNRSSTRRAMARNGDAFD